MKQKNKDSDKPKGKATEDDEGTPICFSEVIVTFLGVGESLTFVLSSEQSEVSPEGRAQAPVLAISVYNCPMFVSMGLLDPVLFFQSSFYAL
jgi:hypothetical protein